MFLVLHGRDATQLIRTDCTEIVQQLGQRVLGGGVRPKTPGGKKGCQRIVGSLSQVLEEAPGVERVTERIAGHNRGVVRQVVQYARMLQVGSDR